MGTHSRKVPSQGSSAERSPGLPRRKQTRPEEAGARSPDAPVRGPTEQGEPGGGGAAGRVNGGEVAGADPAGGFARPGPGVTAGDAGQGEGAAVRDQRQALAQPGGCLVLSQPGTGARGGHADESYGVSELHRAGAAHPTWGRASCSAGRRGGWDRGLWGGSALPPPAPGTRSPAALAPSQDPHRDTQEPAPTCPPLKADGPAAQRHSFFLRLLPWTSSCWERAPW